MIRKEMVGRLGNQMFQYATIRALQELNGEDEIIELSFKKYVEARGHKNELNMFNIKEIKIVDKIEKNIAQNIIIFLIKTLEKIMIYIIPKEKYEYKRYLLEKRVAPILNKLGIYFMKQGYYELKKTKAKNKILIGYFESEKYFNHLREKLLLEFTPKAPIIKENINLYKNIKDLNSVCVTIRRGDFITDKKARKNHYICTPEYFYEAIKVIQEKLENPMFFVFSDDVEWVKNNMKFPKGTIFESGKDPVWEKLRMMYSCKHFIISNSTFSWWAQYLSRNNEKIVVAPSRWRNTGYSKDIYGEKWILIDV